jgi:hypothetical protein
MAEWYPGISESIQWLREARDEHIQQMRALDAECEPGWEEYLWCPCCKLRWGTIDARDAATEWVGIQLDPRPEREAMIRVHLRNCSCGSTFSAVREVIRQGADGLYPVACDLCGNDHEPVTEEQLGRRITCAECTACPPTVRAI